MNFRTVLGLLLFSAALLGGHRLLEAGKSTTQVWVASSDLAQDTVLGPGDVEPASVNLPSHVAAGYVAAGSSVYGEVLTRPIRGGELLATSWLAQSASVSAARSLTIPVEAEHAVGGALEPGDRIDILVTFDPESLRARTVVLARAIEVLNVVETAGLAFGEDALVGVTVAVSPEEATRLTFASRTGLVDVVRVEGAGGTRGPSTVRAGDFP